MEKVKISGVDLVKYLLSKYGPLPQKKLQKLSYFAEYEYVKKYGKRLSDLSFKRYYFGPYSEDIKNIEDLEEDIIIKEKVGTNPAKESELINEDFKIDNKTAGIIDNLIKPYINKNGKELEKLADETEPYIDAEDFDNPIDLDSFAWFYGEVNSDDFWKNAEEIDKENIRKGIYGRHIIKDDSDIDSLFS